VLAAGLLYGPLGWVSILAALPTLAGVVMTFMHLDRLEPEPRAVQLWALAWGATVAITGSMLLELLLVQGGGLDDYASAVIVAPLVEEALKGVSIYLLWKHRVITGTLNAVVYGGLAAAGFAFIENVGYFLVSSDEGGATALLGVVVLRGFVTPFAHPLFTAFTAFGVGYAIKTRHKSYALLGFVVAVTTHAAWNHLASTADGFGALARGFCLIMVPLFAVVAWFVVQLRARERRQLQYAATLMRDVLPEPMAPLLWDARTRELFSRDWLAQGRSRAALRHYISALTHLAIARAANAPSVSEVEEELERTVLELSPWH
jgi:RsiW-degrading membrane proteinase PrsW (M82 family)